MDQITILPKHKSRIKFGTFLMMVSFLFTAISILVVIADPGSRAAWIKGIVFYLLSWALLLTGGFITGRYSLGYILKYFKK